MSNEKTKKLKALREARDGSRLEQLRSEKIRKRVKEMRHAENVANVTRSYFAIDPDPKIRAEKLARSIFNF